MRAVASVLLSACLVAGLSACSGKATDEDQPLAPTTVAVEEPIDTTPIDSSAALQMVIPKIHLDAGFEDASCRVVDGAIDPATLDKACTYTPEDRPYQLPGTNALDIVVIAGHAGAGVAAVFDNLYDADADHHTVEVGDRMFIKTANSGDRFLVYEVTDLHSPEKGSLSNDASVWGTEATPGRLLTISCIQPSNLFAASVRNVVVGWQFIGISNHATVDAPLADVDQAPAPVAEVLPQDQSPTPYGNEVIPAPPAPDQDVAPVLPPLRQEDIDRAVEVEG